jgi:hypothetical protein
MKKLSITLLAAAMFSIVACGPSAEEKAAAEKATSDSLAAVEATRIQDSIATAQQAQQDSIAQAMKVAEDSLKMKAMEDSLAAIKKQVKSAVKPKPKTMPKQDDKPKVATPGQGRG